jgi:hypothetical protein
MRNKTLVEDRLDGSRKFSSWKSRLQITLEEDDLLSMIQKALPEKTTDEEKDNLPPLLMLIQSHIREMKISKLKPSYSYQYSQVRFLLIIIFG